MDFRFVCFTIITSVSMFHRHYISQYVSPSLHQSVCFTVITSVRNHAVLSELHVFITGMIVTVWIRTDHQQGGKS